jgi:hypothetical protein
MERSVGWYIKSDSGYYWSLAFDRWTSRGNIDAFHDKEQAVGVLRLVRRCFPCALAVLVKVSVK